MIHADYRDLKGKTALITGGSGHLGKSICTEFANQGINLVILDQTTLDEQVLGDLKGKDVTVDFFQVDLESNESRKEFIERMVREDRDLDFLVNNAAFVGTADASGWSVKFENQSIDSWRKALEVNLTAPFHLVQGLEILLKKSKHASVVNLGSIYGSLGPNWELYNGTEMGNPAAYAASKGGLIQLTKWLATTLAPQIRVNCVSPGGIERQQDPTFAAKYINRTPLKRMATEDEIVSSILFLISDASKYITGQNLQVDGGWGVW
jgi:NAD(P)-dependent dehydrogenase (short-subunit alcohol dehydrogenase family)